MQTHKALIKRALKDGHTVSVWDGEAWAVKRSTNYRAIVLACDGVDDVIRLLIRDNQGEKIGSVWVLDEGEPYTIIDNTDAPYFDEVIASIDDLGY